MMSRSLRGQFLIATKPLHDPNFFKTVVLIVEHNESGAMGLVVNRPSCVSVAHALSEHFNLPETEDLVYVGGPVEPAALFVLHNGADVETGSLDGDDEECVVPGLYVGCNADVFETVVREACNGDPDLRFRIFSGCAGWAPGQLEAELARGDWYVQPGNPDFVFDDDPYSVWDNLLQKVYEKHRILPHLCQNPELN